MLKEYHLTGYQLTTHFIERAYERFGITSENLSKWLEKYRVMVERRVDTQDKTRAILIAEDGTTIVIHEATKTLVTCFKTIAPIEQMRRKIAIYTQHIHNIEEEKIQLLAYYHMQYEREFDLLMQFHHDMVTGQFHDYSQYDSVLKAIRKMHQTFHLDTKELNQYVLSLRKRVEELGAAILQIESLSKKSAPIPRVIEDEQEWHPKVEELYEDDEALEELEEQEEVLEVADKGEKESPFTWNAFEVFKVGKMDDGNVIDFPLTRTAGWNLFPTDAKGFMHSSLAPSLVKPYLSYTYYELLTQEAWQKFHEFLDVTFTEALPNKEKIELVVQTTPLGDIPNALKKLSGIGETRKMQIIQKLEDLLP